MASELSKTVKIHLRTPVWKADQTDFQVGVRLNVKALDVEVRVHVTRWQDLLSHPVGEFLPDQTHLEFFWGGKNFFLSKNHVK